MEQEKNIMTNTREVILNLKKVKEEKDLSLDSILALIEDNNEFVSKSTLSRVFRQGSEDQSFNYEGTIRPIANALLDIETIEVTDDPDTKAYKSILKLKKEIIDGLQADREKEKAKYHEKMASEIEKFQHSLDFAMHQIELKDKRIDQLLDANMQLLNQLLSCPYHKNCAEGISNG